MTRKFLLVTYHFPPSAASGAFRMLGLARHLPRLGWNPVVVAPPTMPWEPIDAELGRLVPAETQLFAAPYPAGMLTRLARRLMGPDPVWLPRALAACRRAVRACRPEVIITSGPPHLVHLLGYYLKRTFRLPWVADLRDPWVPRGAVGKDWAQPHWTDRRGEALMMQHANVVVANAPLARQGMVQGYPALQDKITMITNGYDPEHFSGVARQPGAVVRVVHTGEIYSGRDPRTFLDALRDLSPRPERPIHAAFLGRSTAGKFNLDAEVQGRGLEGLVSVGGQVPYLQSLRDMAASDVLLMLDGPGRKIGVPAKLYEYLGAARPILALTEPEGDSGWVLKQSGIPHRMIAPPGDPAAIRQALIELVGEIDRDVRPNQDKLALFTREHMARQFAQILDSLCPASSSATAPLARATPS